MNKIGVSCLIEDDGGELMMVTNLNMAVVVLSGLIVGQVAKDQNTEYGETSNFHLYVLV